MIPGLASQCLFIFNRRILVQRSFSTGSFSKDLNAVKLYDQMMSLARRFPQKNMRDHALRRVEHFYGPESTANKTITDAEKEVEGLKRIVSVYKTYATRRPSTLK